MPMVNPFAGSGFDLVALTAAINKAPYKPGRIAELGWFESSGVANTSIIIDEQDGILNMVPTTKRGAPATTHGTGSRNARSFIASRLAKHRRLLADEVLGIRAFGSENMTETIEAKRNEIIAQMRADIEVTLEWHRLGAIKGTVLDADATSVILNIFTEYGLSQQTVGMALATAGTEILGKCETISENIENALGSSPWSNTRVLCGSAFWNALIIHPKVKEAYLNSQLSANLRNDPRQPFMFGGITWERHRGSVGGVDFIHTDEAYAVPEGVQGLFITRFAPADYIEAVNTNGLPLYAKGVIDPMGRGIDIEAQSNPINLCTRPRAIIKLTRV